MSQPSGIPSATPAPRPTASLAALGRLRERVRAAFLSDGLSRVALGALLILCGSFALDYFLSMPRGVRVIHMAVCFALLLRWSYRRVVQPMQVALSDERLALLAERYSPELRDALVTAVSLSRPGHPAAAYLSREMIAQTVEAAERGAGAISAARILSPRRARRCQLGAVLVVSLALWFCVTRPDLAALGARRFLLLSQDRWPKSVELAMIHPATSPIVILKGEDLSVEVKVLRGAPSSVDVAARAADGTRWRDPLVGSSAGIYRKVFENVSQPFRFQVTGGDDELPEVDVLVRVQPSLARLDLWCRYPDSTSLVPTPVDHPILNPTTLQVPVGTQLAFRGYSDLKLRSAFVVSKSREEEALLRKGAQGSFLAGGGSSLGGRALDAERVDAAAVPLTLEAARRRPAPGAAVGEAPLSPLDPPEGALHQFDGSLTVERDGVFFFQLIGADAPDDRPGRRGKVVSVRAVPDRTPIIRIVEPQRSSEEVSAEATVAMEFHLRDDYAVSKASLEVVVQPAPLPGGGVPDPETQSFPLTLESKTATAAPGAQGGLFGAVNQESRVDLVARYLLDVGRLGRLQPGSKVNYHVEAVDSGGNKGQSESYVLHIFSKPDLTRVFNDRLLSIRDQLKDVERMQESARKDLQVFERETARQSALKNESVIESRADSKLGRHRQDQERVTSALGRTARDLAELRERMDSNRVGDEKEKSWVSGVNEAVEKLQKEASSKIEKQFDGLRADLAKSAQPLERVQEIIQGEQGLQRELARLVLRLSEFGDVNAIIQELREIQRRQSDVRDRTKQRVSGSRGSPDGSTPGIGGER